MNKAYLVIIKDDYDPDSEIERFELADDEIAARIICEQNSQVCCEIMGPLPIETVESLR